MGLFDSNKPDQVRMVINLDTGLTNGHAILVSSTTPKSEFGKTETGILDRHNLEVYPRDYPKQKKDFKKRLETPMYLPVERGYLLTSGDWSKYMLIDFTLPGDISRLPSGLNEDLKEAFKWLINKKRLEKTTEELLWSGITERDELLKRLAGLEFIKDMRNLDNKILDDALKRTGMNPQNRETEKEGKK